jgi:hypothetical protein
MIKKETEQKFEPTNRRHKFAIGNFVVVSIGSGKEKLTLSNKLKERENTCGIIVGYRNYYKGRRNYGGNRYYVKFNDGYIGGFFPWHLKQDDLIY